MATDQQKIHPVVLDVEEPPPTARLVPRGYSKSDDGDPAATASGDNLRHPPPFQRTIPLAPLRPPKQRHRRNCCYRCFCWTLFTLILAVVIIAATIGILYLVFEPKIPKYSVDRLRVSDFTLDTSLTAHIAFAVTVTASNPNKKVGIYYQGGSKLSAWYQDTNLCTGSFPEFYQGHRNTTVLTVELSGQSQLASGLISALQQQQQQTGSIPLQFRADVPVKVKLGALKLWRMTFGVRCDLVADSLSTTNLISLRTSSCKLKKLNIFS